jgi:hypothetical protein
LEEPEEAPQKKLLITAIINPFKINTHSNFNKNAAKFKQQCNGLFNLLVKE